MRKSLFAVLPMAALLLVSLVSCNEPTNTTNTNQKTVRIGLDSDTWLTALQTYFDQNPVAEDINVVVENVGASGTADRITSEKANVPDIQLVIDGEVSRNWASIATLNSATLAKVNANAPEVYLQGAQVAGVTKYVPVTYDGMAFAWNKTFLETIGIDMTDADGDNLPDAIDTFEKIFAITKGWNDNPASRPTYKDKKVHTFFPMALTEVWSGYSSLTAEGWKLYESNNPLQPGFEDPKFAGGLGFIAAAADNFLSTVANDQNQFVLRPGTDMGWNWDNFLNDEFAPTGLIGTWMNVTAAETNTGSDYQFSRMPTWKGNQLTPFVKTKGFVINGYSPNPAAAKLVFEKLYSQEALQVMVSNSAYLPALKEGATFQVTIPTQNGVQMANAFLFNYPEPQFGLPNNPSVKAMDAVYYYSDSKIKEVMTKAWDQASANTGEARATWLAALAAEHKAVADAGIAEKNVAPQ